MKDLTTEARRVLRRMELVKLVKECPNIFVTERPGTRILRTCRFSHPSGVRKVGKVEALVMVMEGRVKDCSRYGDNVYIILRPVRG